jgi:SAM-dependent methyltransferase
MDFDYARSYRDLYRKHWWWRAREGAILSLLQLHAPGVGWGDILDIGCGDGLFFDRLLRFGNVEGVEPCADLITPDGPHRRRIHHCAFDDRFQPGKHYSLILLLDVLEHVVNPVDMLHRALGLLTKRGAILITVPAFNMLWTNQDVVNHHITRYTKKGFRVIAENAGMLISEERYWFQWTFPAKLVQRAFEKLLRIEPIGPGIPAPSINRALYLLSRSELAIASRISFPFGSSLLVLGRKADL